MKICRLFLYASLLSFSVGAYAADVDAKGPATQAQVKKLRAQAVKAHKKGDALTAKADRLESESSAKPGEKMRGCTSTDSSDCGKKAKNVAMGVRG